MSALARHEKNVTVLGRPEKNAKFQIEIDCSQSEYIIEFFFLYRSKLVLYVLWAVQHIAH